VLVYLKGVAHEQEDFTVGALAAAGVVHAQYPILDMVANRVTMPFCI